MSSWHELEMAALQDYYAANVVRLWQVDRRSAAAEVTDDDGLVEGFSLESPIDEEMSAEELIAECGWLSEECPNRDPLVLDWDGESLSDCKPAFLKEVA